MKLIASLLVGISIIAARPVLAHPLSTCERAAMFAFPDSVKVVSSTTDRLVLQPKEGYVWANTGTAAPLNMVCLGIRYVDSTGRPTVEIGYGWFAKDGLKEKQITFSDVNVRPEPHLKSDGHGKLVPVAGYTWVTSLKRDFRVQLRIGLVESPPDSVRPADGYTWEDRDDPENFYVKLKDSPGSESTRVCEITLRNMFGGFLGDVCGKTPELSPDPK